MANPNGQLAGFTDVEDPAWMENALNRVRDRQNKKERRHRRTRGTFLYYDDPYRMYFDEAAKRRNMTLAGYARRCLTAMIAFDLGMEPEELAKHMAQPMVYGGTTPDKKGATHDDFTGHGRWRILGMGK